MQVQLTRPEHARVSYGLHRHINGRLLAANVLADLLRQHDVCQRRGRLREIDHSLFQMFDVFGDHVGGALNTFQHRLDFAAQAQQDVEIVAEYLDAHVATTPESNSFMRMRIGREIS
jgi:hypothetical protein